MAFMAYSVHILPIIFYRPSFNVLSMPFDCLLLFSYLRGTTWIVVVARAPQQKLLLKGNLIAGGARSFQIIFTFCTAICDSDASASAGAFIHATCVVYRNTSLSSFNIMKHHVHPLPEVTPNCKKLALIYTLPSSSGSVCDEYDGGDEMATAIDCCSFSSPPVGSSWCEAPPFNCCWTLSTSTTWIGACNTPAPDPRFPCAFSIKSIDVVVVGVVGGPEENLMLYGCRFVNFYIVPPQIS